KHGLVENAHDCAVLGGDVVQVISRAQPAGAGHVLHHEVRMTVDVIPHMSREQPAVSIVAARGVRADDQRDRLALVERFGGGRQQGQRRPRPNSLSIFHAVIVAVIALRTRTAWWHWTGSSSPASARAWRARRG